MSFGSLFHFVPRAAACWPRCVARTMCLDHFLFIHFGQSYAVNLTHRRGTWLVLGLRRYRDEHGCWPSSLDAISAYVPPEAFVDPTNGGRFVYVLDGDSFSLYSTGIDQINDAESSPPDASHDDVLIWSLPKPKLKHEDTDGV